MLLQFLSAKLGKMARIGIGSVTNRPNSSNLIESIPTGIVTQRDLAQQCRAAYSRPVSIALWIM